MDSKFIHVLTKKIAPSQAIYSSARGKSISDFLSKESYL